MKFNKLPTQAELLSKFEYRDGNLYWRSPKTGLPTNKLAGCVNTYGYRVVGLSKMLYPAHRIIWTMFNGDIPENFIVDHIDRNKANNKIENLRLANKSENCRNVDARSDNTSGTPGVKIHTQTGKWCVQIMVNGKYHWFGLHESKEKAVAIANTKRAELHGQFANIIGN